MDVHSTPDTLHGPTDYCCLQLLAPKVLLVSVIARRLTVLVPATTAATAATARHLPNAIRPSVTSGRHVTAPVTPEAPRAARGPSGASEAASRCVAAAQSALSAGQQQCARRLSMMPTRSAPGGTTTAHMPLSMSPPDHRHDHSRRPSPRSSQSRYSQPAASRLSQPDAAPEGAVPSASASSAVQQSLTHADAPQSVQLVGASSICICLHPK